MKKMSISVTIVTIIMLIYAILCLIIWQEELSVIFNPLNQLLLNWLLCLFFGWHQLDGIIYLITSLFIFRLKDWARNLAVIYSSILFLFSLLKGIDGIINPEVFIPANFFYLQPKLKILEEAYITAIGITYIPLIMSCLFLVFFIHPKVKAQFREKIS